MSRLDPETLAIVRAEAAAESKKHARAEGRAQAKLRVQELVDVLNPLRAEDVATMEKLAAATNRLGVMVDVLLDLLVDDKPLRSEGTADGRRAKFHVLCDVKAKEYGVRVLPG